MTDRKKLLSVVARIRKASDELLAAEEELEEILHQTGGPTPPVDPGAMAAAMADAMMASLLASWPGGEPSRKQHELATWSRLPALRKSMVAAGAEVLKREATARRPSTTGKVLAVLLEEPARKFTAAMVAARAGCTEAVARTMLSRLVDQRRAIRADAGLFQAA